MYDEGVLDVAIMPKKSHNFHVPLPKLNSTTKIILIGGPTWERYKKTKLRKKNVGNKLRHRWLCRHQSMTILLLHETPLRLSPSVT